MTITIKLSTENEAFSDGNREAEIERIIRLWLDRYGPERSDKKTYSLCDLNGNVVGSVRVTGR